MRMAWMLGVVGLCAGVTGCSSETSFTVGASKLVVKDALFHSRPTGYYCDGLARNQLQILLVDYTPACPLDRQPGDPDPFDPNIEHSSLEIILSLEGNPLYKGKAFEFASDATCTGGGSDSLAFFNRLAPGAQIPNAQQATSGTVRLTAYDAADANKPAEGTFTLDFSGTKVAGSFSAYSCNQ